MRQILILTFFFFKKKRGKGQEGKPKERPKSMHGCNEANSNRNKRSPVLWSAFQTRPGPPQKNLLALRIGIRLTETVTVAVTVSMQLVGHSEGKVRVPVVFGREVPIVEIMVEVPFVFVRVGDGDMVVLATEAVPEAPVLEPVPVPVGDVPVSDSVPVRG